MHLSLQHTVCILSQGEGKLKMQSKALNVSKLEREGERKEKRKESDRSGRNHFQGSLDHWNLLGSIESGHVNHLAHLAGTQAAIAN